jgi:tetratricopeptide (TPR) repeat protein
LTTEGAAKGKGDGRSPAGPQRSARRRGAAGRFFEALRRLEPAAWAPLLAFLGPLTLYAYTLAPSVTFEDSGEFLTAAYHLGVPHPPGYPLWCLTAHVFTWTPFGSVAQRVHAFSALCGAATCLLVYLISVRLAGDPWIALGAAWVLGASRHLWSQSVVAEVYALNALLTAASVLATLEWARRGKPAALYGLALLLGLGAANHFLLLLTAPPLVLWAFAARPREILQVRRLTLLLLLSCVGPSTYLTLLVRSAANPPINSGNLSTFAGLVRHVSRISYSTGAETVRLGGGVWDGLQHSGAALAGHVQSLGWVVCLLAALGLARLLRVSRPYALASLSMFLLNDVALNLLQRERFNAPWAFTHRVYHIPADVAIAAWFAAGTAWIASMLRARERAGAALRPSTAFAAGVGPVLAAALLLANAPYCDRSRDLSADTLGREFLSALPTNAVVAALDDFVYVLLYLTKVEDFRSDVQIYSAARDMGYDSRRPASGLFSCVPWSDAAAAALAVREPTESRPYALGYQYAPKRASPPGLVDFVTLPKPPTPIERPADPDDVHVHFARSLVSNYYARCAAKLYLLGRKNEAAANFVMAENQASSAYAFYTIAEIYRELGIEPERRRELLKTAVEYFDRFYDPATERMIPLTRRQLLDAEK